METAEQKEWFICAESGKRFQFPNGAKCTVCKRMVSTSHYLYVDMEAVCLKCKKEQLIKLMENLNSFKENQ